MAASTAAVGTKCRVCRGRSDSAPMTKRSAAAIAVGHTLTHSTRDSVGTTRNLNLIDWFTRLSTAIER
jgi:hypothetical protein